MKLKKTLFYLAMTASLSAQAVTLNVKVPTGTRSCYLSGSFNGWSTTGAVQLTPAGSDMFTADLPDVTAADLAGGYKYLCGPDWKYVEKDASGNEISNRTRYGNPDVVGSWAATYNPSIIERTVNIGGYARKLRISLPPDYATSGKSYPVVYMLGVQQRYSAAGSDNAGDDFFGADSWNAAGSAEIHHAAGADHCIMVAMYGFVAENIPYPHPDFMGSGQSGEFLEEFVEKVVADVNKTYRTIPDASATTILGADLGGLLSLYGALTRPDVFGNCVSISPLLMLNRDELISLASSAEVKPRISLFYGSLEQHVLGEDINALAQAIGSTATVTLCDGGWHDDNSWREVFHNIYPSLGNTAVKLPATLTLSQAAAARAPRAPRRAADITTSEYQFYYRVGSGTVAFDNTTTFSLINDYVQTNGEAVTAQVAIKDIPKSVSNTKIYWNVARKNADGSTTFLSDADKNVSFSTKKTHDSWMRVVIRDGESLDSKSASSAGFKVFAEDGQISMTPHSNHTATATVTFSGNDKTFVIHYGSVNSESDMGEITAVQTVSDNCIEADVTYDFLTNSVRISETRFGATIPKYVIEDFRAVPAVTHEGEASTVTVRLVAGAGCTPVLKSSLNYGTASGLALSPAGDDTWEAKVSDLKSGIYTLTLDVSNGTASKEAVGSICIKVLPASSPDVRQKLLTVNAYENVDWATTGRYKANFHTHTSQSFDTKFNTDYVVDAYAKADYKILALTDHDANPYPWNLFDLYNRESSPRDPESLGMIAVPGVELSKDNTNAWEESTGGYFNHHNDFFTGRKGQEFASLRESYEYTQKLGGLQIINHPGQYWNLDTKYTAGAKNSPEWHAENFRLYPSLIGLEVYNQGNRRPNDRILWDQILNITMPERPVWGYSCDDTHTAEQYFRNYQFMLMPEFTVDALKDAMAGGKEYFSYEYNGSGQALAPRINSISVDEAANTITIDTDAPEVMWISGTDIPSGAAPGSRKSTVVGMGKTFDYTGFRGSYVRALLKNESGETATQPFGFTESTFTGSAETLSTPACGLRLSPNPVSDVLHVTASENILKIDIFSATGAKVLSQAAAGTSCDVNVEALTAGTYIAAVTTASGIHSEKLIINQH